ncbi:YHS domain-containing protein [Planctomycetota bacterium]
MGNPIKEDVFADYNGKRVYFCCPGCDGKFMEEPEKYIAQMEAEGVVLAKVVTNGNGEAAMEGCGGDCEGMGEQAAVAKEDCCGKCETILEKLTRIEQLLEQLLSSKTEGQTPDVPATKALNVIK